MKTFVGSMKVLPQGSTFWWSGFLAEAQTSADQFLRSGAQEVIFSSPSGEEVLRMKNPERRIRPRMTEAEKAARERARRERQDVRAIACMAMRGSNPTPPKWGPGKKKINGGKKMK